MCHRTGHPSLPDCTGFTLVELLVVISIIAILLALLAPTAVGLFNLAQTDICKTNLQAIGRASAHYAADNKLYVPRDACDASQPGHYLWAACFFTYTNGTEIPPDKLQNWSYIYNALKGAAPIYRCPSAPPAPNPDMPYVLTYLINAIDHDHYRVSGQYVSDATRALPIQLTHLPAAPAEMCYIIEMSRNVSAVPVNNFTAYDIWHTAHMPFLGNTPQLNARCITYGDDRHQGKTTLVFFDGHCEDRPIQARNLPVTLFNPLDLRYPAN